MPVRKYRDIAELPAPDPSGSPADNLRAVFDLIALCHWFRPLEYHRGVQRFRNIDARQAIDSQTRSG